MSITNDRRGFLRSLASLPLIGGGVALLGNPTAAAEPVTRDLIENYTSWLLQERRHLEEEFGPSAACFYPNTPGGMFHWRSYGAPPGPAPSTRAAIVLSAVGWGWEG